MVTPASSMDLMGQNLLARSRPMTCAITSTSGEGYHSIGDSSATASKALKRGISSGSTSSACATSWRKPELPLALRAAAIASSAARAEPSPVACSLTVRPSLSSSTSAASRSAWLCCGSPLKPGRCLASGRYGSSITAVRVGGMPSTKILAKPVRTRGVSSSAQCARLRASSASVSVQVARHGRLVATRRLSSPARSSAA